MFIGLIVVACCKTGLSRWPGCVFFTAKEQSSGPPSHTTCQIITALQSSSSPSQFFLTQKQSTYDDCNFIIRMLFYDIYWLNCFLAWARISLLHCAACHNVIIKRIYVYVCVYVCIWDSEHWSDDKKLCVGCQSVYSSIDCIVEGLNYFLTNLWCHPTISLAGLPSLRQQSLE